MPPDDAVALADALEYLVTRPEERRRMGDQGRAVFEERFTWTKIHQEYTALLESLS